MTREEAIQMLKKLRTFHNGTYAKPIDMAIEALSADGDLISRADAIEAVCMNECGGCRPNECGAYLDKSCDVVKALSALPSADITETEKCKKCQETTESIKARKSNRILSLSADRPTVIRSRTLMPTKDFKEWAKRVKEVNPNAVVIPCDAEDASAEADPKGVLQGYNKGANAIQTIRHEDLAQIANTRKAVERAAEADRPMGEWQHKPSKSGEWIWWQCSKCGAVIYSESEADRKIHHAYCGVCGAYMKGGAE